MGGDRAHLPSAHRRGRPRETSVRHVVNAIFYIAQSCCQWRMLPKEFPPFTTVQYYFYRWRDDGTWSSINHALVMRAARIGRARSEPDGRGHRQPVGEDDGGCRAVDIKH